MKEIIEIKRKEFTVLERIGEHSFKVERKGKIFFLKKYQDKESFNEFVNNQHRLKITAVDTPKLYLFDKNQMISVVAFIEGPTMLDELLKGEITNEEIYRFLFQDEWYMKREKLKIDFRPENFKFTGKKLVYLPFEVTNRDPNYNFSMTDLRLWFHTKEFAEYVRAKGIAFDDSKIGNEYATNKQIALYTVKYYM